jgi:hypothetical protein
LEAILSQSDPRNEVKRVFLLPFVFLGGVPSRSVPSLSNVFKNGICSDGLIQNLKEMQHRVLLDEKYLEDSVNLGVAFITARCCSVLPLTRNKNQWQAGNPQSRPKLRRI